MQAYHFGLDWISYAQSNGGYSVDVATTYNETYTPGKNPSYAEQVLKMVANYQRISSIGFMFPLGDPVFGSPFGRREMGMHYGQDFSVPEGTALFAVASGEVVEAHSWKGGTSGSEAWGNYIKIKHEDTLYTLYAHASMLFVSIGQQVEQGDLIALSGNTGRSTGPHLHFEVYDGGSATSFRKDPRPYLPQ